MQSELCANWKLNMSILNFPQWKILKKHKYKRHERYERENKTPKYNTHHQINCSFMNEHQILSVSAVPVKVISSLMRHKTCSLSLGAITSTGSRVAVGLNYRHKNFQMTNICMTFYTDDDKKRWSKHTTNISWRAIEVECFLKLVVQKRQSSLVKGTNNSWKIQQEKHGTHL